MVRTTVNQNKSLCDVCKSETLLQKAQRYHYTEGGLDNVYLENVEVRYCETCKTGASRIANIRELHLTIARAIALQDSPLLGPQIKFLRKQLGISAKEWAMYLRVDISTLSRWENKGQQVGPQSDVLIRLLYFRLLEERQYIRFKEPVVCRIVPMTSKQQGVLIDINHPGTYRYL